MNRDYGGVTISQISTEWKKTKTDDMDAIIYNYTNRGKVRPWSVRRRGNREGGVLFYVSDEEITTGTSVWYATCISWRYVSQHGIMKSVAKQ